MRSTHEQCYKNFFRQNKLERLSPIKYFSLARKVRRWTIAKKGVVSKPLLNCMRHNNQHKDDSALTGFIRRGSRLYLITPER